MQVIKLIIIAFLSIILLRLLFRKIIDLPKYRGALLIKNFSNEDFMSEEYFWDTINQTIITSKKNYQLQCQLLTQLLETKPNTEIIKFNNTFLALMANSYNYRLWEAAYALNGGCGDDAFEYFRSWLIGQGKNKFYWTLKFPRLLLLIGVKELIENYEGLEYAANEAYYNKTSQNLPDNKNIHYADGGEMFNENQAFFRYPELALLAW